MLIASLLLLASTSAQPDRLPALLSELRHSDRARGGCFEKETWIQGTGNANAVSLAFQRSRGLADAGAARDLLARLIEYVLRPGQVAFEALRSALTDAGGSASAAEDVCRCVYFSDVQTQPGLLASVSPTSVGLFWAARVLHESGRTKEALDDYQRALKADISNPRTRLLYAIALISEQRPADALQVLAPIPDAWAPEPVAYWRARALLDTGDPAAAHRLLQPIQGGWKDVPTAPDAWTEAGPVQPSIPVICLLGRAEAEEGHESEARTLLEANHGCRSELGRLELRQGRPFEALLDVEEFPNSDPLLFEALSDLGACDWARRDLRMRQKWCRSEHPPDDCGQLEAITAKVTAACPGEAETAAASSNSAVERRLNEPRLAPFQERTIRPAERWTGKRPDQPRSAKSYAALKDYTIAALSPAADRMFAVSVSQDVDPRGEVSAGGYWLHLSGDRGKTWDGPYYLGFADQFPYVVLPASHVPAFDGDRVSLEVERREVDESTITFPPVGLRAKRVERDLYLSIDVAAVKRDSDGDGLTDLLEEKLALDPRSADTDGDGIPDGADPLPLQPRSAEESSDEAQLLAVVLPYLFGGPTPIQQTAASGREASAMYSEPRPFASARTLLVVGVGAPLPHGAGIRAVAFSEAELDAYRRKFGATFPMSLPDIAFDRDKERALIRYDFGWSGGSLLAEKKDGRWTITPRGSWVT